MIKKCLYCNKNYKTSKFSPTQQKFCSRKCKWNYHNKKNRLILLDKYSQLRKLSIKIVGSKCCACKNNDYYSLQIDHINSDGFKDKFFKNKYNLYNRIIKNPNWAKSKFQTLCCNCNCLKQFYPDVFKDRYPNLK